jgi:hypothetical protein
MNDWRDDKRWSDRFIPEIKGHLGRVLISEAPAEEDAERNTDLVILTLRPWRVACRIREHKYLSRYGGEFTIRSSRPSNARTELGKILEGWGDFIFYGFAAPQGDSLSQWFIGSLNAFRLWHSRELFNSPRGEMPGELQRNFDNSSNFRAYRKDRIPGFIVAELNYIDRAA